MDNEEKTHQALRSVTAPQPAQERIARIVVLTGDRAGRKVTVERELVFGRSRRVGLQLDDPQVSRRHARIHRQSAGFVLEDMESRNGTSLNGEPMHEPTPLKYGDRIHIGDNLLLFTHVDPLEDVVIERQKLEAIGRLGTGIAHDFNNLLGAIRASLDFIDGVDDAHLASEDLRACLSDIRTATTRASEMTRRLLGFARRTHRTHAPVDIAALGDEAFKLLRRTFDRAIELDAFITHRLHVRGDRSHLHQLLMNLCINARDAMPKGGTLTLRIAPATDEELGRLPYRDRDRYVLVEVSDTGVGMDEETLKRLFEPFFTTKADEAGAGLGLATVYEVVDSHGGFIDVQSEIGKGTTFFLFLPREATQPAADTLDTPGMALSLADQRPLRILLVDDEDVMRRSATRLLRQLGHSVVEAADGQEAVDVYAQSVPPPDLVLLDLNMPRMGGAEALAQIRQLDPDAAFLVVSGYVENEVLQHLREQGVVAVLQKPFDVGTLRASIGLFLEQREAEPTRLRP